MGTAKPNTIVNLVLNLSNQFINLSSIIQFGFDFLFMHRYSQFGEWKDYFSKKPHVPIISDLTDWPIDFQPSVRKP